MKPTADEHNARIQEKITFQLGLIDDLESAKVMMAERGQSTEQTDRMIQNAKNVIAGLQKKLRS